MKYVDEKFKCKFLNKYKSNPQYRKKMGEHILNALEKFDQESKAEAFGKMFAAYLKEEIDHEEFMRYSYVLYNIDFDNIELLRDFYSSNEYSTDNYLMNNFAFTGLLPNAQTIDEGGRFIKNQFGSKFLKRLGLL
jgi:hypothetical protein